MPLLRSLICLQTLFLLAVSSCKSPELGRLPEPRHLLLNQVQVIASHNSYRQMTTDTVFTFLQSITDLLPDDLNPIELDYEHPPLHEQLGMYGVRGLEIDLYHDPSGGGFSERFIHTFVDLPLNEGIDELDLPGYKVLHIKDVDYNSHQLTFKETLKVIRQWSQQHPHHFPIFINVETKSSAPGDNATLALLGFEPAPTYDQAAAEALEQEVYDVFGSSLNGVFTPDMLRRDFSTLEEAARALNWPTLESCRGKVIFIMEGACVPYYRNNHPSLAGRAMFVYAEPGEAEAAFVIRNNSRANIAGIQELVRQGYIVRTRCDAGTIEAREGDYSGMDAAFESGAQICSTDYYRPDSRAGEPGWSDYHVQFDGGFMLRVNPINGEPFSEFALFE